MSIFQLSTNMFAYFRDKIATASFDKTCKLWSSETGKCYHTFRGHTAEIVRKIESLPNINALWCLSWDSRCLLTLNKAYLCCDFLLMIICDCRCKYMCVSVCVCRYIYIYMYINNVFCHRRQKLKL